jgi:hypothetical protein
VRRFDLGRSFGVGSRFLFEMRVNGVISHVSVLREQFSEDVSIDAARRARILQKCTTSQFRKATYTHDEKVRAR